MSNVLNVFIFNVMRVTISCIGVVIFTYCICYDPYQTTGILYEITCTIVCNKTKE